MQRLYAVVITMIAGVLFTTVFAQNFLGTSAGTMIAPTSNSGSVIAANNQSASADNETAYQHALAKNQAQNAPPPPVPSTGTTTTTVTTPIPATPPTTSFNQDNLPQSNVAPMNTNPDYSFRAPPTSNPSASTTTKTTTQAYTGFSGGPKKSNASGDSSSKNSGGRLNIQY